MNANQKLFLVLLVVLKFSIDKDSQEFSKLKSYFLHDFEKCPKCFEKQSDFCKRIQLDYEFDDSFTDNLNILFGVRHNRVLRNMHNKSQRIFAKYLAKGYDFNKINEQKNEVELMGILAKKFFDKSNLNGMQYCPKIKVKRFVKYFEKNCSNLNFWMHINVNMQPILLPSLHSLGFPVPETYATCGFTIFQSFDGVPLANLYCIDFMVKLEIARQLLEGALKFSEGFDDFRIYITDLNMDNVVYNYEENRLSFVDLDTVLIVDARQNTKSIHKHEFLECYDCFAFSPFDICASDRSDINVFAVCQLLRENLRRDRTKGFLYPVPKRYSQLEILVSKCVDCEGITCKNRFEIAIQILKFIEKSIKHDQI